MCLPLLLTCEWVAMMTMPSAYQFIASVMPDANACTDYC
jgi:hypothetical protein